MKTRKTFTTFLLGIIMCLATCFGVMFSKPTTDVVATTQAEATYTTKDVAMMSYIDNVYAPNGNFYLIITLSELDTTTKAESVAYNTTYDDMPTMFKNFDLFNKVKINGYTLAELGCTSVWENAFDVNSGGGAPLYKLRFHMHADPTTWNNAINAGKVVFGVSSNVTICEGTLIPGYAYMTGDHSATVYRAGCDFVSTQSGVAYSIQSVGKTEVESIQYVTGWDSTLNNAYLGVSLKGDDFAGSGAQEERHPDYYSSVYTTNHYANKITVDGVGAKAEAYGLFNLGSKGKGYYSFVFRAQEETSNAITIPAGTIFPSYAMRNLFAPNGNPVYMMYETQTDVTFYKQADGSWSKDKLPQVKAAAIAEISAYKSNASYEEAVAAQRAEIIANAISAIEAATAESEVESIVANAKSAINQLPEKTTYTVKDIAMMGRVAGWYGNGNFEIRITLGEADWASEATKDYKGEGDLPTALKKLDFFNKIMLGDKTLAEWGCTTCYSNTYWLNSGEPDYTLMIPLAMGSANMSAASAAGVGANYPITILEGALIPSDAYLQGNVNATVYRVGSTFVTSTSNMPYGMEAVALTEVESVKYVQGHDGSNGYFGISLKGDDYLGDGLQMEGNQNYDYDSRFDRTVLVNGATGKVGYYGLFNLGSKGKGYYSFVMKATEAEMSSITIPAGTRFPSRAMTTLRNVNGNPVYIMYEVQSEITFYKQTDGSWSDVKPEGDFDTSVTQVQFGRSTNVINFDLGVNDYPAPDGNNSATYNIGVDAEKILALNFLDNVIVDGYTLRSRYNRYGTTAIGSPWFWVNRFVGHNFAVRIPTADGADIGAQKIVIRAGTQFPSMAYINNGTKVFYVTTEEVTYVRVSDSVEAKWAKQSKISFVADGDTVETLTYTMELGIDGEVPEVPAKEGYKGKWESYTLNGNDIVVNAVYTAHSFEEIDTNISKMEFEQGFLILYLTNNDYPTDAGTIDINAKVSTLHFFNYVEVDGKMISSVPTSSDGAFLSVWNRWGSFASYIPNGTGGHLTPTKSVVLKKGCQIPSNAYRVDGSMTCFVLTEDVTFLNENGTWVRQSNGEIDGPVNSMPEYDNNYILSDLYNTAYPLSAELDKGYLYVTKGTEVFGYNTSQSFSLTFDFSLNLGSNSLSAMGDYTTFAIAMATRGYNGGNAFGWNFYLYRPNNPNKAIEFFVGGAGQGAWEEVGIFDKNQTYRITLGYKLLDEATGRVQAYLNVNGTEHIREYTFGADYYNTMAFGVDSLKFSTNSAIANSVLITDPDMKVGEDGRYNLTLSDGVNAIVSTKAWKYTLPELSASEYANDGEVFIGWTTNNSTIETLYPAGYTLELTADTTLYPVWMYLNMQKGAAVRTVANESGLRFLVNVDGNAYTFGVNSGLIVGAGTIVVPTTYLNGGLEFVHDSFPAGYCMDIPTNTWSTQSGNVWTYAAALINISPAQYTRAMSARAYLKIAYTDGSEAYVYSSYNQDWNARSIYDVATAAYKDNVRHEAVLAYVNTVADITIDGGFAVAKNENAVGDYTVSATKSGMTFTLTFDKAMKAIVVNGERVIAGYETEIVIGGEVYNVSGYKMSSNYMTVTFTVDAGDEVAYYSTIAKYYENSNAYTELYKNEIMSILSDWEGDYSNAAANAAFVEKLESVKTEAELRANVGANMLATPVVNYGLGYTVTWNAIDNADYYVVVDDNDYRNSTYVLAGEELVYKTEVVGKHNVTVTAHSFNKAFKPSNASESFATVEVKPVFSYKAMYDGLYKFSADNMVEMGIVGSTSELNTKNDGSSFYYDKTEKQYFAYYNKDIGWSKNQGLATDWTSPAEFPAHAARLKAMGNNVIMMSEGSVASLKESDVWENSRMKYIMDTAWTMGMKVIVCDDVLYKQSKEVGSKSEAASVINGRMALLEKYINHPAFYGFSLEDEPEPNSLFTGSEMESVGFMIQALKETCANLGYSKANGNEPFFLACLYQYSSGFESFGAIVGYEDYLQDWFNGTALDYVYVDLYTGHAMGDNTNRYEMTYDVVYGNGTNGLVGTDKEFYQVITAHTQSKDKDGTLTEADMYMSMLYAAAHNVAGYSWFCYFPILTEMAGSMVGVDGNGLGNGIGNNASGSYYNAAATAGYQYEVIQGIMNGYKLASRAYSNNLLTTTLTKSGAANITMYVNADTMNMSATTTVTAAGSKCYLIGKGIGSTEVPYQVVSGSVTLQPGQAVICVA